MTNTRPGKAAAPAAAEEAKNPSAKEGRFFLTLPVGLTLLGAVGILCIGGWMAGWE